MTAVLDAMRQAVIAGRMMRALQAAYLKRRGQTELIAAKQAETEFDRLSLAAVLADRRAKEAEESGA